MYRNAIVTTDGSDTAAAALPHVARVVDPAGTVTVVEVIDEIGRVLARTTPAGFDLAGMGALDAEIAEQIVAAQRDEADQHLAAAKAQLQAAGLQHVQTMVLDGLPGDRIQMKEGVLYINDKAVPKVKVADYIEDAGGIDHHVDRYRETLPNGVSYDVLDRDPEGSLDTTQVFVVPEGHYFMMGDNRDNSADSRADVGYVPFENFVGKAEIIFFSVEEGAEGWQFWKWPWTVRWSRLFQPVR